MALRNGTGYAGLARLLSAVHLKPPSEKNLLQSANFGLFFSRNNVFLCFDLLYVICFYFFYFL